jgi:exodeoxyribonuclease VII large subunit
MLQYVEEPGNVLSVSTLTEEIKLILESEFEHVSVRGEISQPQTSRNGHLYFTLKDAGAQLSCVMWSSMRQQLDRIPKHGDEVIVSGSVQVYPPHGRYQLIARSISAAGLGALQQAFEELKRRLQAEGLFDESRKRPLPRFPEVIGVVTSATGAAFQDMRNTLEKRYPLCRVLLFHAAVQGAQAAPEIAEGIRHFSGGGVVDLLIVGRGGGSLEDLWAFNEETVVRAIAECRVPVISAVGHETDFSISDFVADARAATPTQAIVMAVPDRNDLLMRIGDQQLTMERRLNDVMQRHRDTVSRFLDNYALHKVKQRIARQAEMLVWQEKQMGSLLRQRLRHIHERNGHLSDAVTSAATRLLIQQRSLLSELHHRLQATDPNAPLKKGYSRIHQNEQWVRSSGRFDAAGPFEIEWSDGRAKVG